MFDLNSCQHVFFNASVEVNRLEDTKQFSADVKIWCRVCGIQMVFLGLPRGLDLTGASTNTDGTEARLAIHLKGETEPEISLGFEQRKVDHE